MKQHRIATRYYAHGVWHAESGLHTGGEGSFDSNADMALLRDSEDRFFVPGASIAGAVRNFLVRQRAEFHDYIRGIRREPADLQLLFGNERMSLLTIFDAFVDGQPLVHTRDGVRINNETGVAFEGAKYDFEVLPAGSRFNMRFLLNIYEEDDPGKLLPLFHALLAALQQGSIRLGARTRRGLGQGRLKDLQISELDMAKADHVKAWLAQKWELGDPVKPIVTEVPAVNQLTIEAALRLKTSLLIRSAGDDPAAPDMVHLSEEGKQLLTGTSLAGALRHRCERIANTMCPDIAQALVTGMFGMLTCSDHREALRAGRVWVDEQVVENSQLLVQSRVKIDRFTGGAFEGALFTQAPLWPADAPHHVTVRIHLDLDAAPKSLAGIEDGPLPPSDPRECALLLQTFKDLWLGELPLGGEVGGGRGVFLGVHATFKHPRHGILEFKAKGDDPAQIEIIQGEGNWETWNTCASTLRPQQVTHARTD